MIRTALLLSLLMLACACTPRPVKVSRLSFVIGNEVIL
jgi:hypothetical protein